LPSVHHTKTTDTFVTNKDTHDHLGGDGAQIQHSSLGGVTTSQHHVKTVDTNLDSSGVVALGFVAGAHTTDVITKTWFVENPVANDSTLGAIRFPFATTIDSMICVLTSAGGASTDTVTINFKHSTDRSENGPGAGGSGNKLFTADQTVNSNTVGNAFSTFNDATVPTNTWLAPYVVTQGGTVSEIIIQLYIRKDP